MPNGNSNFSERELHFSRLLNAPIKLVWDVWTNAEHIKLWWGPDGFTNTIQKMDIKPGGEWNLIMHGPDGTDYEIRSVFKEIIKHKKIVYQHLNYFKYVATIEFSSRGDKTFISWTMVFEDKESLVRAAKTYGVDTGFKQNAEKLVMYLFQFVKHKSRKNEKD